MDKQEEIKEKLAAGFAELKDFQRATVEHVFQRLYKEGRKRHLVADEVGLGKTIVAKGLIAKALERHLRNKGTAEPFRVVYICSNQSLARQNLRKLNVFKDQRFQEEGVGRLVFLAYKERSTEWFRLGTLTPSTSFQLTNGQGVAEERRLIWFLLSRYKVYTRGNRGNGLKLLLKGSVQSVDGWRASLQDFETGAHGRLRPQVHTRFKERVQAHMVNLDGKGYSTMRRKLGLEGEHSLQDILLGYCAILRANNLHNHGEYGPLVSLLRKILTEVCLEFLDADLFILDEFQRFKDLVDEGSEQPSDAAKIARKVFGMKRSKVLLLSATPFKPFTTEQEEQEFGDIHHEEFEQVLSFLFGGDREKIEEYRRNRGAFQELLRHAAGEGPLDKEVKHKLEGLYREVMSRTERLLVSQDGNTLVKTMTDPRCDLLDADIKDFIHTDRIVQALKEATGHSMSGGTDFSRSSPSPLSFLDQYQVKRSLKDHKASPLVRQAISTNADGWLDLDKVARYKALDPIPNHRMRLLMKQVFPTGMHRLLWLPPTLPYYAPAGVFKDTGPISKVLLFSRWRMVPRAVSSLVSYEAERLTIGHPRLAKDQRHYWPEPRSGRDRAAPKKPLPRLPQRLKDRTKATSMFSFVLLYPSLTLARLLDPRTLVDGPTPIEPQRLKARLVKELKRLVNEADLQAHCVPGERSDHWYWAAPVLLDRHFHGSAYEAWLGKEWFKRSGFIHRRGRADGNASSGAQSKSHAIHLATLRAMFRGDQAELLGAFPPDLFEVLAEMVLASPAVACQRILQRSFPETPVRDLLNNALDLASEFTSLFDKPASIAIVDLHAVERKGRWSSGAVEYTRNVLSYCVDGNLQSVLDEFTHLVGKDHDDLSTFKARIGNAVNIRTPVLEVDDAEGFLKDASRKMRCHFALEFGGSDLDSESGQERADNVLDNFNSPFWPFVLASTSIGQEGLDFHLYCRKVVHWNLPNNAIDLEQREGRVNRYKGLVIRQNLVMKYRTLLAGKQQDPWEELFAIARKLEGVDQRKSELVPYWHVETTGESGVHIERIHPLLPYSRDIMRLEQLLWVLTLYRLTLGQPRQEELLRTVFKNVSLERLDVIRRELMIDLCPMTFMHPAPEP